MTAHDYPVPKKAVDDLEREADRVRAKCGLGVDQKLDVFQLLFGDMPRHLKDLGLTLVSRNAGYMAEREAYAAPSAKRIFYRPSLLARLKFGDPKAALIFLHELAHILLHSGRGGADKAWFTDGNDKIRFISDEESAEWQATNFALCLKAPEKSAGSCQSVEELCERFSVDLEHGKQRFEILQRKKRRKIPPVYGQVRAELTRKTQPCQQRPENIRERCPVCGEPRLVAMDNNYYCTTCRKYGPKFQDGDLVS